MDEEGTWRILEDALRRVKMVQRPIMLYFAASRPKTEKQKTWNKNHVKPLGVEFGVLRKNSRAESRQKQKPRSPIQKAECERP
jgi:hypothetical protein